MSVVKPWNRPSRWLMPHAWQWSKDIWSMPSIMSFNFQLAPKCLPCLVLKWMLSLLDTKRANPLAEAPQEASTVTASPWFISVTHPTLVSQQRATGRSGEQSLTSPFYSSQSTPTHSLRTADKPLRQWPATLNSHHFFALTIKPVETSSHVTDIHLSLPKQNWTS